MTLVQLPRYYGPRQSLRGKRRKPCAVVPLAVLQPAKPEPTYRELYERASQIDDNDPHAGLDLYERALVLAKQAGSDKWQAFIVCNMGNCHYTLRDQQSAAICYREAIRLDPNQPEANYNLGYLELQSGRDERALELLQLAVFADPGFADAWYNLGIVYQALDRKRDAANAFRRYVRLVPSGAWTEQAKGHISRLQPARLTLVR